VNAVGRTLERRRDLAFLLRIFKFFWLFLCGIVWLTGLLTLAVAALLYVAERPVPRETLARMLSKISTDNECVDASGATFGLRNGLVLRNIRLLPKHDTGPAWATAEELRVIGGFHTDRPPQQWVDAIQARHVNVASLPKNLFVTASTNAAGTDVFASMPPMRFDIVDGQFIGLRFKRAQGVIRQEKGRIFFENLKIDWPSDQWKETTSGQISYDPKTDHIEGRLSGRLVPERLYPLFRLLGASDVEDICRRFTFQSSPIEVEASFVVAPEIPHDELRLTLSVDNCTYNGVVAKHVSTVLNAEGSNGLDRVTFNPMLCERTDGSLSGSLVYDGLTTNLEVVAQSDIPLEPLMRIIELPPASVKDVIFFTPPKISAIGRVALEGSRDATALSGTLTATAGTIRRVPVKDIQCQFGVTSNSFSMHGLRSTVANGTISGDVSFFFLPVAGDTQATYRSSLKLEQVDLESLAASMFDTTNSPTGKLNGNVALSSRLGDEHNKRLSGEGLVKLDKGLISRMPLFAGFTDHLAKTVPGVSSIVELSKARLPFTITNGVLRSDDVTIDGDVFGINGNGRYDIPADNLDFIVRANINGKSLLGFFPHFAFYPFSKLLLEYQVKGPLAHPEWKNVMLNKISDDDKDQKESPH
jgi:hypothetical protein